MKNVQELLLFKTALQQPMVEVTLTSFLMDLPNSNAQIHLCVFRNRKWRQLTAMLLPSPTELWDFWNPPHPRGELVLPDYVVRHIKNTLRRYGIRHLIGIRAQSRVPKGVLLYDPHAEKIDIQIPPNQTLH